MPTEAQDKSSPNSPRPGPETPNFDLGNDDSVYYRSEDVQDNVLDNNSTRTKNPIKAMPTLQDHTTSNLNHEQDEFIPSDYDESGEKKVSALGELSGGRVYNIRTFSIAHRGKKQFMLATECARALGYRDSYLLFNKNRSLHKIIATPQEKEDLITQEILPYSYRSRQVAIVTAKSMFRQFGARVIGGGRRVRDDYWEAKAIKRGFTEENMPGDRLPRVSETMGPPGAGYPSSANNHALDDYQLQLALLKQQNQKRLSMKRQKQRSIPRDEEETSPYSLSNAHGDSYSRAITSAPTEQIPDVSNPQTSNSGSSVAPH